MSGFFVSVVGGSVGESIMSRPLSKGEAIDLIDTADLIDLLRGTSKSGICGASPETFIVD